MRRFILAVAAIAVAGAGPVAAQTVGRIEGTVKSADGRPLFNARVILTNTTLGGMTDAQGHYAIDGIPQGTVQVEARAIGYKAHALAGLRVLAGQTISALDFALERLTVISTGTRGPLSLTPTVLFRFQLIRPMGEETTDSAIVGIDSVLHDLFHWRGYRLLSQAAITVDLPASTRSPLTTRQLLSADGQTLTLRVIIDSVMPNKVRMSVDVSGQIAQGNTRTLTTVLSTTVTVWFGNTVVLGSTQPGGGAATSGNRRGFIGGSTLILAVKPEVRW